ncbi:MULTISPECIES: PD40 domain-containing protein [unclassified Aureispira]|uniref:PD40 domain-containing protein n=1 Tax=unclassified Aureispira TaxID=2649989 RepID=UPI000698DD68|nr:MULTISPECIES: PD40 domain-containing protein [unclassified Aureispira]WMX13429.1 PD40 domain-containing protein [Aureispira sp. CCB-E]
MENRSNLFASLSCLTVVCLLLLPFVSLQAQNLKAYEKAADDAFAKKEYYNAMHYYDIVLRSKKTPGVYYKYAEACRLSYAYDVAEEAYKKVIDSKDKSRYPMVEYYYGVTLKHNAKYSEAKRAFKYFLDRYKKDNFYKAKAEQEMKSCDFAKKLVQQPIPESELEFTHLSEHVNTKYSDFGAHEIDSVLYYSSLRFDRKREKGEKKDKDLNKPLISKILTTPDHTKEKGKEQKDLNLPSEHSANSALSHDGNYLYFTRCSGKRSDSLRCEIYRSEKLADGKWSAPERLPNPINSNSSTTTHPNLAWDQTTQSEWLYFSSDRAGGQGGMDIWRVELKDDLSSSEPYNLGAVVNSIDAEVTPYFSTKENRLYFASRWHLGLGGYDIFSSDYNSNNEWSVPVNLGIPYNSAANDLYYVRNANDTTGYIASNRDGSRSLTKEACCNDIYHYAYLKASPPDTIPDIVKVDTPKVDTPDVVIVPPPVDTPDVVTVPVDTPDIVEVPVEVPPVSEPTPDVVQELDDLLPLSLYFHNDEPDSNVTVKFTNTPYEESYAYYTSLIEEYKREYSQQFGPERAAAEQGVVQQFFDDKVRGEYNRTQEFFDRLLEVLEKGAKLKLYIRGYTSPKAEKKYNIALANRRVSSLRNFMMGYKNGAFKKYVNQKDLIIKEAMLGESLVPKGVSDDHKDPANSIYSVAASQERKAEISVLVRQ